MGEEEGAAPSPGDAGKMNVHNPQSEVEFGRSLVRALRNTGIVVIYQDLRLRVIWSQNVPPSWSAKSILGAADRDFLPESEAERLVAAKKLVIETGTPAHFEVRVNRHGAPQWFDLWIDADRAADGSVQGILTTAVETTEQKRREQTLKVLLREVSHRSKNLLAIIQGIATQTGRYAHSIESFLEHFRGRLQSLSSSQDLVTSSNWRGAYLRDLVEGQVSRFGGGPATPVRFSGEDPFLSPNAALHVGLALHELAVNSIGYGALSRPGGLVELSAEPTPTAANTADAGITLTWQEDAGLASLALKEKSFGSIALERVVPTALNGSAELTLSSGQLTYRLFVPAENFEAQ